MKSNAGDSKSGVWEVDHENDGSMSYEVIYDKDVFDLETANVGNQFG